ncbi:MAG: serine hydrolase [Clostridiaceae bacterium]|nr:serine hydrolase [Clostridiaceae bacterium]
MKSKGKLLFVFCLLSCGSFLFSGCGTEKNELLDYHIASVSGYSAQYEETASQEYLSADLCVIPKNGETETQDAVMTSLASLMINDTEQTMLYSHNIYEKIYPASITKIVTALVALKYGNLDDTVTISYNASHITEYGAKLCGFAEGDQIVLNDLLYSFLICSGNDAGVAIAEHIAGDVDSFSDLMNQEMERIGAVHSHFVNPHGLHDDDHYTTAYDLYLVFHQLVKDQRFLDIVSQSGYTAKFKGKDGKKKKLYFTSTDRYLLGTAQAPSGVTVIGGKTGTTYNAGSCLILYSKNESDQYFISVVLKAQGAYDLYSQMNNLLAYENQ